MSSLRPQIEAHLLKHAWRWNDLWKLVKPTLTKRLTSWDASCVRGDQNIHMWQREAASVASSGLQVFRTWKWVSVQPRFDKQVSAWIRSINPTPSAEPAQTAVDETSSSCRVLVSEIRTFPGQCRDLRGTDRGARHFSSAASKSAHHQSAVLKLRRVPWQTLQRSHLASSLFSQYFLLLLLTSRGQQVADNQSQTLPLCVWVFLENSRRHHVAVALF